MIVLLVLGFALLLFTLMQYVHHRRISWLPLLFGLMLVAGNSWGLANAQREHLFMQRESVAKTEKIAPSASLGDYHFVTTTKVGKGLRYTYKIGDQSYQTLAEHTKMTVKHSDDKDATLQTTVKTYRTQNMFDRLMRWGEPQQLPAGTDYVLTLPTNWHVVNKKQYAQLVDVVKHANDDVPAAVTKRIKHEFALAAKSNDDFTSNKKAQAHLKDQITKDELHKAEDKMNEEIGRLLAEWHR